MSYCTKTDILNFLPQSELTQLTDDDGNGIEDTGILDSVISSADATIDGYLQVRKAEVPLSPVPNLIKDFSVAISIFYLHSRRGIEFGVDDIKRVRYENAIKTLEKIAEGKLSLGEGSSSPQTETGGPKTNKTSNDSVFTRDSMEGF